MSIGCVDVFSAGARVQFNATVVTIGCNCVSYKSAHTHAHTFLIPHLTRGFLSERINLWKQLNHITLCKYPQQLLLSLLTTTLAPGPMAPLAHKCTWGKLTFALIVCKWQLVLPIEMKQWPLQEIE